MQKSQPKTTSTFRIGVAGWNIPHQHGKSFAGSGSHLERYASMFSAVEINSTFYRPHRITTYERWSATVPNDFKFAAKVPREITHRHKLKQADDLVRKFIDEIAHLGEKLGPLLVQLPPSLRYDEKVSSAFFGTIRRVYDGQIVCEPRHATWFTDAVEDTLVAFKVARVAADPACVPRAGKPGGWPGLSYWRLHGSPKMYYSSYGKDDLASLASNMALREEAGEKWCIFDNTALGNATGNALELTSLLA